jgi:hypothetical protein
MRRKFKLIANEVEMLRLLRHNTTPYTHARVLLNLLLQ